MQLVIPSRRAVGRMSRAWNTDSRNQRFLCACSGGWFRLWPLFSSVVVGSGCWGNAWARASRVSTCVGVYAKPLLSAVLSVFHLWGLPDIPRVGWLLGNTPLVGYSFASMTDESDENNGFLSIYTWCAPDIGCVGPVPGPGRVRGLGQTNPTKATALGCTCCTSSCLGVLPPHRDRPRARPVCRPGLRARPWPRVPDPGRNAPDTGVFIMPTLG